MMDILTDITGRKDLYGKYVQDVEKEIEEQLQRADTSSPSVLFLRAYSTGVRAKGSDSMTGGMLKELGCVNIADSDNGLLKDLSMEAVSFAGLLGFAGLLVPHMARLIAGEECRYLLPVSALLGAPFFLRLLFGRKRRGRND